MKARNLITVLTIAAMLMAFASTATAHPEVVQEDPIAASFEREFGHETVQPKAVTRDDIDSDELYERINKPLQTPDSELAPNDGE